MAWWYQAEPPGGWLVATLALLAVSLLGGILLPSSPIGKPVRESLGVGGPMVLAWVLWFTWLALRQQSFPVLRGTAIAVLTGAAFVVLELREATAGGALGGALLAFLDAGFGRVGGVAVLVLILTAALLSLLGGSRVSALVTLLRALGRQGAPSPRQSRQTTRLRSPIAAVAPLPVARSDRDEGEIVILGPGSDTSSPPPPKAVEPVAQPRTPAPAPERRPHAPTVWQRPDLAILGTAADSGSFSPAELKARAKVIEETLAHFNVQARVVEVQQGPAITQFGLDPAPGVAVSRIVSRQHDLALRLGAPSLRVLAPVPGRPMVGLEVPNTSVATVKLGDLLTAPQFSKARLPIGVGMDVSGKPVVADLARMPHLLVAGATGSGKSVCINTLISSLLIARSPDEVQFILIDPKQVEMSQYKGLPHLRLPVVTDMDKVVATLRWAVMEMEKRYNRFSEVGARNIVAFNERFPDERLGYLVIVIDELADMMMTAAEDVERLICRLAQLGRAAGVHLVVATQRPSVDVLTGLIKANLPTRIAFAVSSQTDSRVILDRAGAERLLGRGDSLYQAGDEMNPRRVQGAFASDDEIEELCNHWRAQGASQHTLDDEELLEKLARQDDPEEKLLAQARQIIAEKGGDVSVAHLARRLKIGTQKAIRIHQALVADEAAARAVPPPEEGG